MGRTPDHAGGRSLRRKGKKKYIIISEPSKCQEGVSRKGEVSDRGVHRKVNCFLCCRGVVPCCESSKDGTRELRGGLFGGGEACDGPLLTMCQRNEWAFGWEKKKVWEPGKEEKFAAIFIFSSLGELSSDSLGRGAEKKKLRGGGKGGKKMSPSSEFQEEKQIRSQGIASCSQTRRKGPPVFFSKGPGGKSIPSETLGKRRRKKVEP